jgi:hypothetical protein
MIQGSAGRETDILRASVERESSPCTATSRHGRPTGSASREARPSPEQIFSVKTMRGVYRGVVEPDAHGKLGPAHVVARSERGRECSTEGREEEEDPLGDGGSVGNALGDTASPAARVRASTT